MNGVFLFCFRDCLSLIRQSLNSSVIIFASKNQYFSARNEYTQSLFFSSYVLFRKISKYALKSLYEFLFLGS